MIATKVGARPRSPGGTYVDDAEGLSAKVIRESAERSMERMGLDRIDLMYSHIEDRRDPGRGDRRGPSPPWSPRAWSGCSGSATTPPGGSSGPARRRRRLGLPGYEVLQYQHSYLRPRFDLPDALFTDGNLGTGGADLTTYMREEEDLTLVAYSPLLSGRYTRTDKEFPPDYRHPGVDARLARVREIAAETGATRQPGRAGLADGPRPADHPAGRRLVTGPAGGEPGGRGPGADGRPEARLDATH